MFTVLFLLATNNFCGCATQRCKDYISSEDEETQLTKDVSKNSCACPESIMNYYLSEFEDKLELVESRMWGFDPETVVIKIYLINDVSTLVEKSTYNYKTKKSTKEITEVLDLIGKNFLEDNNVKLDCESGFLSTNRYKLYEKRDYKNIKRFGHTINISVTFHKFIGIGNKYGN